MQRARAVCSSSKMLTVEREDIVAALDEIEKNRADTAGKYCTPARLRCDVATDRDRATCLRALRWTGPDIYRPRVK